MAEVHLCFPISESVYKSDVADLAPCGSAQGMITGQTYLKKWGCTTHLPKSPLLPASAQVSTVLTWMKTCCPVAPADLHDTSDHSNFTVHTQHPHKRCNAHFQKEEHGSRPGKIKGMAAHHQCLKTTRDNRPLRRWNLSFSHYSSCWTTVSFSVHSQWQNTSKLKEGCYFTV